MKSTIVQQLAELQHTLYDDGVVQFWDPALWPCQHLRQLQGSFRA